MTKSILERGVIQRGREARERGRLRYTSFFFSFSLLFLFIHLLSLLSGPVVEEKEEGSLFLGVSRVPFVIRFASAWHDEGHMLVAAIAREYVSEETAKKINFIFSQWAPQYPTTSTFETAAVWLDHLSCGASEIRKVKDLRSTPSHDSAKEKSTEGKIKEDMQTNPDEEEEGDQRGGGKYCRGFLFLDNIQLFKSWHFTNFVWNPQGIPLDPTHATQPWPHTGSTSILEKIYESLQQCTGGRGGVSRSGREEEKERSFASSSALSPLSSRSSDPSLPSSSSSVSSSSVLRSSGISKEKKKESEKDFNLSFSSSSPSSERGWIDSFESILSHRLSRWIPYFSETSANEHLVEEKEESRTPPEEIPREGEKKEKNGDDTTNNGDREIKKKKKRKGKKEGQNEEAERGGDDKNGDDVITPTIVGSTLSWNFQLRSLFHIYGDLHQPLHAIETFSTLFPQGDEGGNLVPVVLPPREKKEKEERGEEEEDRSDERVSVTDLHSVWDSALGQYNTFFYQINPDDLRKEARRLKELHPVNDHARRTYANFHEIARESFKLAQEYVYSEFDWSTFSRSFLPYRPSVFYIERARKVCEKQIALAGARLGLLLEDLSPHLPLPPPVFTPASSSSSSSSMFSQLPSFSFPFFSSSGEGERREEEKEERERERYEESPTFSPSSGGVFSSSSSQSPRVGWLEVNEEETHKEEEKKIGEERRKEEGEEKSEKEEEEEKRGGRVVLLNDSDTSLHAALLVLKYSRPLSELFCTLLLIILLLLLTILYMYRQVRFYKYAVSRTVFMEDREEGEGRDRSIRKLFSVGLLTASPPHTEEGGVHTLDETTGDRQYLQNDQNAESRRKNRKKNRLDEEEVSMHAQAGGGEEEEEIKESGCGGGRLKILQEGRRSLSSQSREVGDMSRHLLQHDSVAPSY